jgi:outer membrane protein TolC
MRQTRKTTWYLSSALVALLAGCAPWAFQEDFDRLSAIAASGLDSDLPVQGHISPTGALAAASAPLTERSGPGGVAHLSTDRPETPGLPNLDENATLSDYLAYAALGNPGLRSAFERFKAALEKVPQARALPDPRLNFGYFIREVETRVGPQEAKIGLSQMFPWAGKRRTRAEAAMRAGEAALARYEALKLKLFYRVKQVYWKYWYLSRAVAITEENLRLLTRLESVARQKYAAGTAPHSAVIKAQVEMGKLEDRLKTLGDFRSPTSARLSATLGRTSEAVLPWPSTPPAEGAVDVSYERLMARLKARNPELRAADAMIARGEAAVKLAQLDRRPDVMAGLDYVFTTDATMGSPSDSGKDPIVAMFSITLPFLNKAKYRAAEREAELLLDAAEGDRADKVNDLSAALQVALYDFRDSERKIDLYRDTLLPKARQALEVARQGFEAGRTDFLDLIDAERTLLEFDLSYAKAQTDQVVSLARTEMLVGGEVAPTVEEETPREEGE